MDMGTDMVGMFAISKAGHDKGTIELIVKGEAQWVYLLDGRLKIAEKPKKKNKKHTGKWYGHLQYLDCRK